MAENKGTDRIRSASYGTGHESPPGWLLTGGCGFIGTNLIARLLKESPHPKIRVLDNLSSGARVDLSRVCRFMESDISSLSTPPEADAQMVRLYVGDIRDYETCFAVTRDIDVIVHLAANTGVGPSVEDPRTDMETNVFGTFNMLEAARQRQTKRFIFASSGAPAGEVTPPIHEEIAPHPVSPYGASKLSGEGYCSAYYRTFGLETVCLRFGNVYGPGSKHKNSVVAKFIRQALEGEELEIYGDGEQTRDFVYIEDLTRAIMQSAAVGGIGGETFQIATNQEHSVNELVETLTPILTAYGIKDVRLTHGKERSGDVRRNFSDTSKAKRLLGWQSEIELDEGLRRTVRWFLG